MIADRLYLEIKDAYLHARRNSKNRSAVNRLFTIVNKMWDLLDEEAKDRLQEYAPGSARSSKKDTLFGNI